LSEPVKQTILYTDSLGYCAMWADYLFRYTICNDHSVSNRQKALHSFPEKPKVEPLLIS